MPTRSNYVRFALLALVLAGALSVVLAACGGGAGPGGGQPSAAAAKPSSGWKELRLRSGVGLPYPSSWTTIHSDPGTASAALFDPSGTIRAYLNVTPAVAEETLAHWTTFRLHHNAEEGDRSVTRVAAPTGVSFGSARASCVIDDYTTSRTSYRELACLVDPPHGGGGTVLVAAAEPGAWAGERGVFHYAFNHFTN
jgi:hypothetical protein